MSVNRNLQDHHDHSQKHAFLCHAKHIDLIMFKTFRGGKISVDDSICSCIPTKSDEQVKKPSLVIFCYNSVNQAVLHLYSVLWKYTVESKAQSWVKSFTQGIFFSKILNAKNIQSSFP